MPRRSLLLALGVLVFGLGFYLFRPDTLLWSRSVSEDFPGPSSSAAEGPQVLFTGRFHGVAHQTSGTATIHRLADGKRILRLSGFSTSNGPDVRVVLGKAADAADSEAVKAAGFLEVAPLKGNVGDQNYDLPDDLDLAPFHSVTIWCNRFGANFGTAPFAGS